jgi:catechol 2,3-dioxygenase-like lactoylglutathione lyase family enzyme
VRPQPLIAVRDVEASSRWYQHLLGCQGAHGGPEYERLQDGDRLIMQLHHWGVEHDHGEIGDPDLAHGNGVLLWFEVEDFDAAVTRGAELEAGVVMAPHRNPPEGEPGGPAHREVWLRDPDGYTVVLASPDGEDPLPGEGRPSRPIRRRGARWASL